MEKDKFEEFYNSITDRNLASILKSILVFKSDYDHNHDDKYAKLENVYTKNEIDNILSAEPFITEQEFDESVITADLRKYFSEIESLKEILNSNIELLKQIPSLKKQINDYKTEYQELKTEFDKLKSEYIEFKKEVEPLLERKKALIYSADNIIARIKI